MHVEVTNVDIVLLGIVSPGEPTLGFPINRPKLVIFGPFVIPIHIFLEGLSTNKHVISRASC